jgi:hypothetical protein
MYKKEFIKFRKNIFGKDVKDMILTPFDCMYKMLECRTLVFALHIRRIVFENFAYLRL